MNVRVECAICDHVLFDLVWLQMSAINKISKNEKLMEIVK